MPAAAQSGAQPAGPDATTLDAVQVTAQRRVENIQDVPVSITAVGGEKLDVLGSGGGDVRFLSGRVPSLNIESSYGRAFPRFYIRGLGNTDFDLNASQPVSLVYDEVVQESPLLKGFPVFDLERVEVLRGPQGTLFGRNTPAGVVKFESVKPSQDAGGYLQAAAGSDGMFNFEGAYGGPLTERWSARASALYQRRDDSVDNAIDGPNDGFEGYDESAARVQFLYEGDAFEALFNLHKRHMNGTARLFRANIIAPGTNDLVSGFDRDVVSTDGVNFSDLDTWGGSARLRWDLGRVTLYSVTGYETAESLNRGDIDGGSEYTFDFDPSDGLDIGAPVFGARFPAESADGLPDHRQVTQEFRLESNEWGRFDWQAGLFWFDEDISIDSFNYDSVAPGNPQTGLAVQDQRNKAWAAFASGDFEITDRFTLRGGLRYTEDQKDFSASVEQAVPGGTPVSGPYLVETDVNDVSWDLSGVYALNDDVNVYARVAKGFRAPSIQGRLAFGGVSTADSEEAISYEAGIKADVWDRRARVGFNVFRYDVDDQQIIAVGGGANTATLLNADSTRGQGFELDLEAYLTDHLLVTLGSSYNDTEIDDPALAVPGCGGGCTVTDPETSPGSGLYLIDGNRLPQAPEWVHALTMRYGVPMGAGEFFVFTDWAYRSEVNFFLYESIEFTGKSMVEGGLRVGYNWNQGDHEVALFGRNITDTTRVVGAIDFNNLTGFLNEPRTWGMEYTARF
ncbi:TonB-dependent receptor [Luteimonas sp. RD2P54]|uniref:TonB-dependent receptor n=2 Tax=Luteimonas endophytica TaxID=3042023 RepID=A0ABT6J662_9GAMM|nr:TonB-dependent receptor [Luteimonas endophytica]MDH5822303.1 TonB-dependent receptor [Luteimonas endophytica]